MAHNSIQICVLHIKDTILKINTLTCQLPRVFCFIWCSSLRTQSLFRGRRCRAAACNLRRPTDIYKMWDIRINFGVSVCLLLLLWQSLYTMMIIYKYITKSYCVDILSVPSSKYLYTYI